MPTLRQITDPVRRDGYLQLLARRSGVDERVLLETLRRPAPATTGRGGTDAHAGARINLDSVMATPDALDPQAVERALEPVESTLLRLLLLQPGLVGRLSGRLTADMLVTTPARELWTAIESSAAASSAPGGTAFERRAFIDSLEPTMSAIAQTLYARTDPLPERQEDLELELEQCLLSLERRRLWERIDYTRVALTEAQADGEQAEVERLLAESLTLQEQRFQLDRRTASTTLLNQRRPSTHKTPTPTPAGGPA